MDAGAAATDEPSANKAAASARALQPRISGLPSVAGFAQFLRAFLAARLDGAAADGDLDGVLVQRVIAGGASLFGHGGSPGVSPDRAGTGDHRGRGGAVGIFSGFAGCGQLARRNALGERPYAWRKAAEKWLWLAKPSDSASADRSMSSPSRSSARASRNCN